MHLCAIVSLEGTRVAETKFVFYAVNPEASALELRRARSSDTRSAMSTNASSILPVHQATASQTSSATSGSAEAANGNKSRGANRSTKTAGKLKVLPEQPEPLSQSRVLSPLLVQPVEQEAAVVESPVKLRDDRAAEADEDTGADDEDDDNSSTEETSDEQQDMEDVEVRIAQFRKQLIES